MNYTQNYQLPQWAESDRVLMDDFNDSYQKIDAALQALDDALEDKADQTILNNVSATLSGTRFDVYDLQHEKGNCQIEMSDYVGTGACGSGNPNVLHFSEGEPLLVLILDDTHDNDMRMIREAATARCSNGASASFLPWGSDQVSWYSQNAAGQMNESGETYHVLTLLNFDDD